MQRRLPIGVSDFRALRADGLAYVDKTLLVRDVIDDGAPVLLLPRPRRFGKSLGLSMLRHYFERSPEDLSALFQGLAIAESGAEYRRHFQRYPVIFLTFKDVKGSSMADCLAGVRGVLSGEYERQLARRPDLLSHLSEPERVYYERARRGALDRVPLWDSLRQLSLFLSRAYEERVVLLLDEYDTPIHAAFAGGYYDAAIELFRGVLSAALKDNSVLYKAVVTGVLRIAKESIFSGLNNLKVHTLLSRYFATAFGFTEAEVRALAEDLGLAAHAETLRDWYNGYLFGAEVIYNPWSVLNYLASPEDGPRPYWTSTSSNELLQELLLSANVAPEVEVLLRGEGLHKPIEENLVLRDLPRRAEAVWDFLLFSGYLKLTDLRQEGDRTIGTLAIPNREVLSIYRTVFSHWIEAGLGGAAQVQALIQAILGGDEARCEALLGELLLHVLSVHDTARQRGGRASEQLYHAFILGLLSSAGPRYEVRSNREAGHGRYDVMILPREAGQPGAVLELKVLDARRRETPRRALAAALRQLREKDYAAELRARAARPIRQWALVFSGKRAWVQAAEG